MSTLKSGRVKQLALASASGAAFVMAMTQSAAAQTATAPAPARDQTSVEEVVVTGSRLNVQGYSAPTPVTIIGVEAIDRDAKVSIGDVIRELPQVTGGNTATANNGGHGVQGDAGVDTISARNLGDIRTLVLFDGQRVVSSSPQGGGADLSTIPSSLVQRIDVVTGGASAAYGSDALAAVANLILNKNFTGLKANASYSNTGKGDYAQYKGEVSFGREFLDGRGHVILSGNYSKSPDTVFVADRDWWDPVTLVDRSVFGLTSGPKYVPAGNYGTTQNTAGGLITASAAGVGAGNGANALRGIQFVGTGTPAAFSFGTNIGSNNCINCSSDKFNGTGGFGLVAVASQTHTLFNYTSFDVTDDLKASLQLNYGHAYEQSTAAARASNITIRQDNAYLDPTILARMQAGGIPSFTLATNNMGSNMDPRRPTYDAIRNNFSTPAVLLWRDLTRAVFTLEGTVFEDFSWNAYAQHSRVFTKSIVPNNSLTSRYNQAVDAVRVTAANRGTSGLPIGSIVCRSTLTSPGNGCQPINVFGFNNISPAALKYIAPGIDGDESVESRGTFDMQQTVAAASISGSLPWGLPAGPIAIASGAEYRVERQKNKDDPQHLSAAGDWQSANFVAFKADYNVAEAYAETNIPLLKDSFVQSLDLNAAGRVTNYSNSGQVETWKLGLISQINDTFKLRATLSRDIRAPVLSELYSPALLRTAQPVDPHTGLLTPGQIPQITVGNPDLQPEVAKTFAVGMVFTPTFLEGFSASIDYYKIDISDAIRALTTANVLAQCNLGLQAYCDEIEWAGPPITVVDSTRPDLAKYIGTPSMSRVYNRFFNAFSQWTSGIDLEADYRRDLFEGVFAAHFVANYMDTFGNELFGISNECSGQVSGAAPCTARAKLRFSLSAGYSQGPWSATVQTRVTGKAKLVNSWVEGVDVEENDVPAVAYLDLRTSYKINDSVQIYANGSNLTDEPPPRAPNITGGGGNAGGYDQLGRQFTVGLRLSY